MKLYEKMGIDLNTVEGLAKIIDLDCGKMGDKFADRENCRNPYGTVKACCMCMAERLLAEVPTKKRWETYEGDFVKAGEDHFITFCKTTCVCGKTCEECFAKWLMEDVEVEE